MTLSDTLAALGYEYRQESSTADLWVWERSTEESIMVVSADLEGVISITTIPHDEEAKPFVATFTRYSPLVANVLEVWR